MAYAVGKPLFAFVMSRRHGAVLALELVVAKDNGLKFVKRLDDVDVTAFAPKKEFDGSALQGECVSTYEGKAVKLSFQTNDMKADIELSGHLVHWKAKPFNIHPHYQREGSIAINDADHLFVFDPETLSAEGPCHTHLSAFGINDDDLFENVADFEKGFNNYINNLKKVVEETKTPLSHKDVISNTIKIRVRVAGDGTMEVNGYATTTKPDPLYFRNGINTMMRMQAIAMFTADPIEVAIRKRKALLIELQELTQIINANGQ
ncbi:MAG: hypothetical protein RSD49_01655 [Hafnia sp.]